MSVSSIAPPARGVLSWKNQTWRIRSFLISSTTSGYISLSTCRRRGEGTATTGSSWPAASTGKSRHPVTRGRSRQRSASGSTTSRGGRTRSTRKSSTGRFTRRNSLKSKVTCGRALWTRTMTRFRQSLLKTGKYRLLLGLIACLIASCDDGAAHCGGWR